MRLVLRDGNENTERELSGEEALSLLAEEYGTEEAPGIFQGLISGHAGTASLQANVGIFSEV